MFQRDFIFQSSMKILSTILYWKMTSFIIIFFRKLYIGKC